MENNAYVALASTALYRLWRINVTPQVFRFVYYPTEKLKDKKINTKHLTQSYQAALNPTAAQKAKVRIKFTVGARVPTPGQITDYTYKISFFYLGCKLRNAV